MRTWFAFMAGTLGAAATLCAAPAHATDAATCAGLAAGDFADVTVNLAEEVPAGELKINGEGHALFDDLPRFCRVAGVITPRPDSGIQFEVWLPVETWNGRLAGAGNGMLAGSVLQRNMARQLKRGYAVVNSDTGHSGKQDNASFGAGDVERVIDFGHRAVHLMTVTAKEMVTAYYGEPASAAFWHGCSTGGRQGLAAAQHYPEDYDAIVAGAPANKLSGLLAYTLLVQSQLAPPGAPLARHKLPVLHEGAIAACDADDGVVDRIISLPEQCSFDPADLQCDSGDGGDCLTAEEVESARRIYAGAVNPRTGELVYPAPRPGSERGWNAFARPETIASSFYRHIVYNDVNWDYLSFDYDEGVARAAAVADGAMETDNPDISAFLDRGGKLILWHGWTDGLVLPDNTIEYYQQVVETVGAEKADESVRLFMAPSMEHCGRGEGPNVFDALGALERWYDRGQAPERIVARGENQVDGGRLTRPLCPYPMVALYDGEGDHNDHNSFVCAPAPG